MSNKTKGRLNDHRSDEVQERRRIILEMHASGLSAGEITRRTGIPNSAVLRHIHSKEPMRLRVARTEIELTVEERRKKVLELNNSFQNYLQIAKVIGTSPDIVRKDLSILKMNPANKVIPGKKIQLHRIKQKAALPGPDTKITCPACGGDGVAQMEDGEGEECLECIGTGQTDTFYGNIVKEPVLVTSNQRIMYFRHLIQYLGLTDWQQLLTWYKRYGPDEQKNNLYFEKRVGDGFIIEELNKRRKYKVISQQSVISGIRTGYELNGITTLPWKRIIGKIVPPEGRKPDREIDAYNMDQIKILYHNSNPTYKALIAFLMSGPRVGGAYQNMEAIDRIRYPEKERFLRLRDLKDPLGDLTNDERRDFLLKIPAYEETPVYEMNIYSEDLNKKGDADHYACWSTPEFYYLINEVLKKRQKDGELDLIDPELKNKPFDMEIWREKCPDSPVFRAEYGKGYDLTHPIENPLTFDSMTKYVGNRRRDFLMPMKKRVKLFNGFRSYVQTILEHKVICVPPLTPTEIQWLMGRELPGMGEHYDRWAKIEQLTKFWNALEWLTIGEMREKFLNQVVKQKDKIIDQKERENQQQWAAFSGVVTMTKQTMQDVSQIKKQIQPEASAEMMKILMANMTPEQIAQAQKDFLAMMNSSLPSERKPVLLDVTPPKRKEDDKGEEHI